MLNVIRGVLGGLVGALTAGVLFVATSYALALMVEPVSGSVPGLYLSLALGTLAGILVGMGVEARLGRTLGILGVSLGSGVVGATLAHFAARLLYWGVGGQAGSLEALGVLPEEARMGVYALTIVGTLLGVVSGSVVATSEGLRRGGAADRKVSAAMAPEGAPPGPTTSRKTEKELPRSKAPGVDEVPVGQHPADSMSVEELLGDED